MHALTLASLKTWNPKRGPAGRHCHWPPAPLAQALGGRCCQPAAGDDHSESPVWEREWERKDWHGRHSVPSMASCHPDQSKTREKNNNTGNLVMANNVSWWIRVKTRDELMLVTLHTIYMHLTLSIWVPMQIWSSLLFERTKQKPQST